MAPWVTGVKTGHTFGALYVLVGSGQRKGVELISVAVGAPTDEDRFADNIDLLDYGFSLYKRRVPVQAGAALARPSIRYSGGELPLRAARSVAVGLRRGQRMSVVVQAPERSRGADRARRGAGPGQRLRRRTTGGVGAAARRPRRLPRRACSTGSAASSMTRRFPSALPFA